MIRLNHVSKIYGDGSKKAVDDLSWDIEDGKITRLIGHNIKNDHRHPGTVRGND